MGKEIEYHPTTVLVTDKVEEYRLGIYIDDEGREFFDAVSKTNPGDSFSEFLTSIDLKKGKPSD